MSRLLPNLIACAALLAPAVAVAQEQEQGRIQGLVFDDESGVPLVGIEVELDGELLAATDEDGAFELDLPPGTYSLVLSGEGYAPVSTDPLPVVAGEVSEVILDLKPSGDAPEVDVEAPEQVTGPVAPIDQTLPTSTITGRIVHQEEGTGVAGFRVFVRGLDVEAETDGEGRFSLQVPIGVHDLSAVHPEFSTISENDVAVVEGKTTKVEIEAVPMGIQLDDFVVTAPAIEGGTAALLEERQEAGSVSDVIGAEQMSKAGDSDAAGALKRVTGVTVVNGKYIYVRGLGERYSATLLNGSTLPSPEPERRVVPLDLFPTGILDSVVIQKSFTPDMPAEFGGGVVQLRTRGYPSELTLDLKVSTGMTVGTTFTQGLMSERGPTDWLGWDNGWRSLPPAVSEASQENRLLEGNMFVPGYTADELEKFGEALRNNWYTYRDTIPPDAGGSLTVGHTFKLRKVKVGFLASAIYANEWDREEKKYDILALGADEKAEVFHSYQWDETTNEIRSALIFNLGLELGEDHLIRSTTLLNRITDNSTRLYWGYNRDIKENIRITRIRWVERQLLTQQLVGEHTLPPLMDLGIDWRWTFSRATRLEPDRKEVGYYQEGDTDLWTISSRPDGNSRLWSELLDESHDLGFDVGLPFEQWSDEEAVVTAGGNFVFKERGVDTRRYKYKSPPTDPAIASLPPWELFTPQYIGYYDGMQVRNRFEEITRETDSYDADQEISAGYGMVDFPLGWGFELVGGLRVEKSVQNVRTFQLHNPDVEPIDARLETVDYLPAAILSWEFIEDMLVRVGFGQTVSRPDFRELSPATFTNVIGGRDVEGNPDLKRTLISNVDARWEWYPSPGETISFGGFYKYFQDPIEMIVILKAQHGESYANAKAARNFGLELDYRKSFDFIHDKLKDFYAAGNATWVYSRIELREDEGIQTNTERPLQGQSPYVINAQLGYDNVDWGTSVALLYNVFGKRIATVGAVGLPDVYEMPFHQLDLVASQALGAGFKLGFKAQNLIDAEVRFSQAGQNTEVFRKGRSFSLSLSYSY